MPISWGPTLMVDLALLLRRVAIADDPELRNRALELAQLLGRELHVRSSQVLVQMRERSSRSARSTACFRPIQPSARALRRAASRFLATGGVHSGDLSSSAD